MKTVTIINKQHHTERIELSNDRAIIVNAKGSITKEFSNADAELLLKKCSGLIGCTVHPEKVSVEDRNKIDKPTNTKS